MKAQAFGAFVATALLAACATPHSAETGRADPGPRVGYVAGVIPSPHLPRNRDNETASGTDQRVHFKGTSALLTPEAVATLDRVASRLRQNPALSALIAGSTANRTTEEYGIALGHRRATNARDYLRARGVEDSRVTAISYGPRNISTTAKGRAGDGDDIISLAE